EYCTGFTADCPADAKTSNNICRAAAGLCDLVEYCDGISDDCPGDQLAPSTSECRPVAGTCDVPELCTGSSTECPTDLFQPSSYQCRSMIGECDVGLFCSGTSAGCPAKPIGTPCTDDQKVCTSDVCDGGGTCGHPAAPAPQCPQGYAVLGWPDPTGIKG